MSLSLKSYTSLSPIEAFASNDIFRSVNFYQLYLVKLTFFHKFILSLSNKNKSGKIPLKFPLIFHLIT